MSCAARAFGGMMVGTGTGSFGGTMVGTGTGNGDGTAGAAGAGALRTGGETCVRPRFESPSTLATPFGARARVAGAKKLEPSGALKLCRWVWNARPVAAGEPLTRTSRRFAETSTTRSPLARAHRRTAAADGAWRALNWAGVSP